MTNEAAGLPDAVVTGLAAMLGAGVLVGIAPASSAAGAWMLAGLVLAALVAVACGLSTSDSSSLLAVLGRSAGAAAIAGAFGHYLVPEHPIPAAVAQSGPATDEDADSLLTAARETFTTAEADRTPPTVPEAPSSDDLFLSTLEAAAGDAGAGYQEIRDLLAPLLGHPTLKRADLTRPQSGDLPTPPAPGPEPDGAESSGDRAAQGADSGPSASAEPDAGDRERGTAAAGPSSMPEVGSATSWSDRFAPDAGEGEEGTAVAGWSSTPEVGSAGSWGDSFAQGANSDRSDAPEPDAGDGEKGTAAAGRAPTPEQDVGDGEQGTTDATGRSLTPEVGSAGSWDDRSVQGVDSGRSASLEPGAQGTAAAGSWGDRFGQGADSGRSISPELDAGEGEQGTAAAGRSSVGSWGEREQGTASDWSSSAERDGGARSDSSGLWRDLTAGLGEADMSGSWRGLVAQRTETGTRSPAPGSDSEPTLPLQRRQMVPGESEQDDIPEVPEPARRGNIIIPKEPDGVPSPPNEPDGIPPEPGREPLPEVPEPAKIQPETQPEPEPETQPEPAQPEPESEPPSPPEQSRLEAALGPVHGPEPRVDDLPRRPDRSLRRPERSDTTSIAELLTEALVAYQETTPDEEPEPAPEPVSHERMDYEHTESRPSGRHRLPDWDGGV